MAAVSQQRGSDTASLVLTATTRPDIFKRFLRETRAGSYGTTTAQGADATELIDTTKLKSGTLRREQLIGAWVRIPDVGSAAYHGEIRSIVDFVPETGTIEVEPPFSATVAASVDYEIWRLVHPQDIIDSLGTLLTENYWEPVWTILSEVDEYDFEGGAIAWEQDSNATGTATSSIQGMTGKYCLAVATTSANGYVTHDEAITVIPGESYTLMALSKIAAASAGATANLILYDETNSATIETISHQEITAIRLYKSISIPSTCRSVSIRLSNTESGKTSYWDDVVFFRDGDADIRLPWFIKDESQVKAIYRWVPTQLIGGSNPNVYTPELRGRRTHAWQVHQDLFFSDGPNRLISSTETMTYPLFILAVRNQLDFSGTTPDSQEIHLDRNYIHACLAEEYYSTLLSSHVGSTVSAKAIEKNFVKWSKAKRLAEYSHATRVEKYLKAPEPWRSWARE